MLDGGGTGRVGRFGVVKRHEGIGPLPAPVAILLVTVTSAAVLVLEILASRLMAPYVGSNLETYTAIIGTILAGIAIGAWAGGVAADRYDPRRLIALLLITGGALAILSIPMVRLMGGEAGANAIGTPSLILTAMAFFPGAGVLSAIPPAVVKLQLRNLDETGSTVGSLSAWGTGGAIVGTFLAGFVLVAHAAVTTLIIGTGVVMIVMGIGFAVWKPVDADRTRLLSAAGLGVVAIAGAWAVPAPCDTQTSYYCVSVEVDPDRETGRILVLDDLRHSYVDLADPTYLEFWYIRTIVDVLDEVVPVGPIDVVAVGGGGLTVPNYVRATRPGSTQTVLEIDAELIEIDQTELGLELVDTDGEIEVLTGDGRVNLRRLDDDRADVVIGDAFGSRAVPWHLATEEFFDDVARVLKPGGVYIANIIDGSEHRFLSAEAVTVQQALPYVAVIEGPGLVHGDSGNSVLVASDQPFDLHGVDADGGRIIIEPDDLADYLDGAQLLTDNFAPVDQLILS